ncbi:magnesium-translocating P-type ATPase [Mycobacterium nebraskense]|uniref:Magnesium-transporting ATPase, P-type 1 n=1 Tax=Mycobacterium nebraskense TaxID=244292 RepID=A0A0F5N814_9MYCO|nr:magnesium-translocating P-type ATPase [Mycobacterium nebraskense]KKC02413.1 magnesium ABC transporter ATPase [Mycobacterium nebraskense]KLO46046.1 magnesium ABC transporter ATPase [Mycobacterium nebraskense]MBI2695129.1 magnesium-translocating P-type ATPase [Mycobacterium nebraskense]MCV7120370.1 magnesium-translocating P-type ATPase [Mycobacterium nebraskense]ORW14770.1 magnesium-transporting ATPase [Mycobacterium nebraskense]
MTADLLPELAAPNTTRVAAAPVDEVLRRLDSSAAGLSSAEAAARLARYGPNAVRTHHVNVLAVLGRQLRNAVLILLAGTAVVSYFLGDSMQAVIIGIILVASIGLGFINEYRAERAAADLHASVHHNAVVRRDGEFVALAVTALVPGDVIRLSLGEAVPADVRLIDVSGLECNESILTGESTGSEKSPQPVPSGTDLADATDLAFMGTIVSAGEGTGVVYATGKNAEFGRIAAGLDERQPETGFQVGLRRFSYLLLQVAVALMVIILISNLLLAKPIIDSVLFSLAIAVGITPQLLPAVVSTGLATGSRQLAKAKVLVKRLVCIEDLGDIDILITDKTGTLTEGRLRLVDTIDPAGAHSDSVRRLGLLATDVDPETGGASANTLDAALWESPQAHQLVTGAERRIAMLPFDHERRATSALVDDDGDRMLVVKGAPEQVLAQCRAVAPVAEETLAALFAAGRRVVAVAAKPAPALTTLTRADECELSLAGFLVFADEPKSAARQSLSQLADLGIELKIATGDNPRVAEKVCGELGLASKGTITGAELDLLDDDAFTDIAQNHTIFARISPEQKARLITALRRRGRSVGFLGDGVNDALALHAADVGISVDSATDVAKDAADVVLLEKDLGVLATGVAEGRRIFANTIKYVLMGTSSNFGNMFSAAAASALLPFLPMLPSQILLNNLLYDTSQLAIPTDRVDAAQLQAPSHWDVAFIRRFMLIFGPISSLFDFLTFGLMLGVLHAGAIEFRTGWFVESLATQTLIIFVIRTRMVPFFRSRPSALLAVTSLTVVAVGAGLTISPLARTLGFTPLPWQFFAVLGTFVVSYLVLVELGKLLFYSEPIRVNGQPHRTRGSAYRIRRRAARYHYIERRMRKRK